MKKQALNLILLTVCVISSLGTTYVIKEGGKEMNKSSASSSSSGQQADNSAAAPAPREVDPPPAPAAAPRDSITVETLK